MPVGVISGTILGRQLAHPVGITSDDRGNLYLVDAGNNRLIKFDSDLRPVRDAGGFGYAEGLLNGPTHIEIDNNLNLYVSDPGNQRVSIYDASLNFAEVVSLIDDEDPLKYGRPSGLVVNRFGEVWIADYDKAQILIYNNVRQFSRIIGGSETIGLFLNPEGMCNAPNDRVLVCDAGNGMIKIFDNIGVQRDDIGYGMLDYPFDAVCDRYGNIWVCDAEQNKIFCFNMAGDRLFGIGESGSEGSYSFDNPCGLTVTPDGRLVISDKGNNRLVIYEILYQE